MRIVPHTAVFQEPARTSPARTNLVTGQSGSSASSAKSTATSKDPFTAMFESLSKTAAGSVTQGTVPADSLIARSPVTTVAPTATPSGSTVGTAAATVTAATAATAATVAAAPATAATSGTVQNPGIQALVSAIVNGSFQPTYVTDPSQLQETTFTGTYTMPNFYYASDQTAQQLASLLGGTVVQRAPFGQDSGPLANYIQLPNGQTFSAADVAYSAKTGPEGAAQLTANLTQTINEGAAWSNYYVNGGSMPSFPPGYVGPPINGMTYPAGSIGADGNVINPAMQGTNA
jgi:hypothetical protein